MSDGNQDAAETGQTGFVPDAEEQAEVFLHSLQAHLGTLRLLRQYSAEALAAMPGCDPDPDNPAWATLGMSLISLDALIAHAVADLAWASPAQADADAEAAAAEDRSWWGAASHRRLASALARAARAAARFAQEYPAVGARLAALLRFNAGTMAVMVQAADADASEG